MDNLLLFYIVGTVLVLAVWGCFYPLAMGKKMSENMASFLCIILHILIIAICAFPIPFPVPQGYENDNYCIQAFISIFLALLGPILLLYIKSIKSQIRKNV